MRLAILVLVAAVAGCDHHNPHGSVDAPGASDAPAGATFQCGTATCSLAAQYCYEFQGGVGGVDPTVGCNDLPAACVATRTCDCVMANTTSACGATRFCSVQGAAIT